MSLAPKPDQELAQTFHQWAKHGADAEQMSKLAYARALSKLNIRPSNLGLSRLRELNELAASKTNSTLDKLELNSQFRHFLCFCAFFEALVEAQKLKQKLSVITLNPAAVNLKRCAVFKIGESRFMPVAQWLTPWPAGNLDLQADSSRTKASDIYLPSSQFESEQTTKPKSSPTVEKQTPKAESDQITTSAVAAEQTTPTALSPTPTPLPLKDSVNSQVDQTVGSSHEPITQFTQEPLQVSQQKTVDPAHHKEPTTTAEYIDPVVLRESETPPASSTEFGGVSYSAIGGQRFALQPRPYFLAAALPVLFLLLQLKEIWILWQASFQSDTLVGTLVWTSIWLLICLLIAGVYFTSKIEVFATKAARQSWFGSSQAFFDSETHFVHTKELTALGPINQTVIRTRHDYLLLRAARPHALISTLDQLEETRFFPEALQQIKSGQTLEFGSLTLTRELLSYGNQVTPPQSIASLTYDLEWVDVTLKNGNRFAHVPAAAIDSARRLKLLIEALSSEAAN